jgi:hypothetical protein
LHRRDAAAAAGRDTGLQELERLAADIPIGIAAVLPGPEEAAAASSGHGRPLLFTCLGKVGENVTLDLAITADAPAI